MNTAKARLMSIGTRVLQASAIHLSRSPAQSSSDPTPALPLAAAAIVVALVIIPTPEIQDRQQDENT